MLDHLGQIRSIELLAKRPYAHKAVVHTASLTPALCRGQGEVGEHGRRRSRDGGIVDTKPSQIRLGFRVALTVCVLAISYLAFSPTAHPTAGMANDKLEHFVAFLVLAWLADRSYPGQAAERMRWGSLLAFAVLIEAVQGLLPSRDASLLDLFADAAGIVGYMAIRRMARRSRAGIADQRGYRQNPGYGMDSLREQHRRDR